MKDHLVAHDSAHVAVIAAWDFEPPVRAPVPDAPPGLEQRLVQLRVRFYELREQRRQAELQEDLARQKKQELEEPPETDTPDERPADKQRKQKALWVRRGHFRLIVGNGGRIQVWTATMTQCGQRQQGRPGGGRRHSSDGRSCGGQTAGRAGRLRRPGFLIGFRLDSHCLFSAMWARAA